MYDLDEISDDYDLDIVVAKYERSNRLLDELMKHFYLDIVADWLNQNPSPRRIGLRFNNLSTTKEVENVRTTSD